VYRRKEGLEFLFWYLLVPKFSGMNRSQGFGVSLALNMIFVQDYKFAFLSPVTKFHLESSTLFQSCIFLIEQQRSISGITSNNGTSSFLISTALFLLHVITCHNRANGLAGGKKICYINLAYIILWVIVFHSGWLAHVSDSMVLLYVLCVLSTSSDSHYWADK
jgi:hypothetical protein